MKLFKLSLLEIKKQKLSFVLFIIIAIVFFATSIFVFNFSSTINSIGISPFINDKAIIEVNNYKNIDESLVFENSFLDNKYRYDEIFINGDEIVTGIIVYSSETVSFNKDEFEISSPGYNIGEEVTVTYNGTEIKAKVVSNYSDNHNIYFSYCFSKYSKCNTLTIEVTKENNLKFISLYNNHKDSLQKTNLGKYVEFVSAISFICVVLMVLMVLSLCIILWNFISYLINNNRKQIAINLAIGYKKRDIAIIYSGIILLVFVIAFVSSILLSLLIINIANANATYHIDFSFLKSIIVLATAIFIQMLLLLIKYKRIFSIDIASEIKEVS